MSNSPLISATRISPNRNSPRNHKIDTITIHCYVGQASIEDMANWLTNPAAESSANYGIGSDGRIILLVDEKDRSWCSSSPENDNRAVTIECASDSTDPFAINSKVYNSLIKLCTDICKRNGIKELKWKNDPSLIGQVSKQNMTVHRWFAPKACPGDYIFNRLGQIAKEVNKNLGVNNKPAATKEEQKIWKFFSEKGLNDYAVAGLMGNLQAESALKPTNLQNSFEDRIGHTDDSYTKAVDDGSYQNFVNDSAGYGLAQWTFWSRKQGLLNYAKSIGKSIGDMQVQLEYLWTELNADYMDLVKRLKEVQSVKEASNLVLLEYEKPGDMGEAVQKLRASYSQEFYDKLAKPKKFYRVRTSWNDAKSQLGAYEDLNLAKKCADENLGYFVFDESGAIVYPEQKNQAFQVRVDVPKLNIRTGAGTNFNATGFYTGKGVFTITEVKSGEGSSSGWGRLKSGAGWISLDYATRL